MKDLKSILRKVEFEYCRSGMRGLLSKMWRRLLGPSRRELLQRIDLVAGQAALQPQAIVERLDATMRYVVDQALRESEERTLKRVSDLLLDANAGDTSSRVAHEAVPRLSAAAAIQGLREELEAFRRSRTLLICDAQSDFVLISDYGFDIMIPASERGLQLHFLRRGLQHVEAGVRQAILDTIKPGDIAVDIGANVGLHASLLGRLVGAGGRLYAFEPHPVVVQALRRTIEINGLQDWTTVEEKIVCNIEGETEFFIGDHSPISSIFSTSGRSISRKTTSLDGHLPAGSRVNFIKIDAEGAEPLIWDGMQRVLADNPRITIVMEVSRDHFGRSQLGMASFYGRLSDAGFAIHRIHDDGKRGLIASPSEFEELENANILLLRG